MNNVKKNKSRQWLKEHLSDVYVKRSVKEGFRARAVYKLSEINLSYQIIKRNMTVIDLGAAPGSWSEYAVREVGKGGRVIALDLLPIRQLSGVETIQGDFNDGQVVVRLLSSLSGRKVDVVLSDMAPNLSGNKIVDQVKSCQLAEAALDFTRQVIKPGGSFLIKVFQGIGFDEFFEKISQSFGVTKTIKPDASRNRSSEVFLLARKFK